VNCSVREVIQETYSVTELLERKKELQAKLTSTTLSEEEMWEIKNLMSLVNKRIQLMNDLLVGFQPQF
jgi:hypothetical protein